jgi:hypothetical protein
VREGLTPQEAVDAVVNAAMDMAASHHPDWTAQAEMKCATSRMNWVLGCLQKEHWQSVEAGHISADIPPVGCPPSGMKVGRPGVERAAGPTYTATGTATASGLLAQRRKRTNRRRS